MAVADVRAYYEELKKKKSPVITAGSGKTYASGGPGVIGTGTAKAPGPSATMVQAPGPLATMKAPGSGTPKAPGPLATMVQPGGGGGSSRESEERYLTGYDYSPFRTSGRTEDYYDKLSDLEGSRPADFQSQYKADIDKIVSGILNRPKFETDDVYDSDLYKTYRDQYISQGQKAMRDTMGSAAGMTGGYGSTYAQAAGQQAYDAYLSGLGDKTLDIYDRVYNQYLQEGQELYNQLGMLNSQDSIDYGRYRDKVSDYYNDLNYYAGRYDQSYNQDFGEWQADLGAMQWAEQYAYQKTQDALAQENWQAQMDYQKEQDALAQQNWQAQFDYQKEQDAKQLALAYSRARSGGSGGGKSGKSSQKESKDGYAPIAAGVVEAIEKNHFNNQQAYNYVMQLGEQGKISDEWVDDILKMAGIDETKALNEQKKAEEKKNAIGLENLYLYGKMRKY